MATSTKKSTEPKAETSTVEAKDAVVTQPDPVQPVPTYQDDQGITRIAGPKQPAFTTPSLDPDPEQVKRAKARERS